ncbi:FUSC family protein [Nesterenkonia sp. LB17]|uniref:FUSC family protein n=1 Tax=unclassified Nesterenkonia TaxID=2629769 RepID=UPI001F4CD18C|nr:FUSC family protein [Nesterenkonia sp. YGD6]MCH8566568.1 FUSC family protein [Nesterenkonia sp. LB17]MCH8571117.1 FUSC family protein [Nesterenkonia sp. AY15]
MTTERSTPPLLARARRFTQRRVKVGARRMRRSVIPALQMTVAGVGAYTIAERVLGHDDPLFAAIAAMIALGFTKEPRMRKVLEVSVGCTLGILIGDLLLHQLGSNLGTATLVLFLSIMLARFLDSGPVLAMQMGLQALLVVLIPPPEAAALGPFTRSLDAIVGGAVALAITLLTPKDPRREPIAELKSVVDAMTASLRDVAEAVRNSDSRQAWHSLIRCRGLQPQIDELRDAVRSAKELTVFSPAYRKHRHYVRHMAEVADHVDLSVRSMRVVARRIISTVDHATLSDEAVANLSAVLDEFADGSLLLSQAVSEPGSAYTRRMNTAQEALSALAQRLHPKSLGIGTLEGETVVLLLRTLVVDMLQATGASHEDATEQLPEL